MWITIPASCYVPLASRRRCLQLLGRAKFLSWKNAGKFIHVFFFGSGGYTRPLIVCTFLKDVIGIVNQPGGILLCRKCVEMCREKRAFLCFTQVLSDLCVEFCVFFLFFWDVWDLWLAKRVLQQIWVYTRNLVEQLTWRMYHLAIEFHINVFIFIYIYISLRLGVSKYFLNTRNL